MQQKYFFTLNLILFSLIVILISGFLIFPVLSSDCGYYLSIAKEIYIGKIYFKEIASSYNPLAILLLGLPYLFSNHPPIQIFLLINLFFIIGTSFVIFKIISLKIQSNLEIIFYLLLFILGTINLEARSILLEPISVFFQITGFYFYLKSRNNSNFYQLFISGILISMSFLSKQYGLFILGAIGIDIILNRKRIFLKSTILMLGFLIPILIFYAYLSNYDVKLQEFVNYILGKGSKLDIGNRTGIYYNLRTFVICTTVFLIANSYVLIVPIFILKMKNIFKNENLIYILALLFSFLILTKASFYHYYQYILPYCIIVFAILDIHNKNKFTNFLKNISFFGSILFMGYTNLKPLIKNTKSEYEIQKQTAATINNFIPKKSKVFLNGISQEYYYLCDFNSMNLSKIGYSFPEYFFAETIVKNMDSGSYILISNNNIKVYSKFLNLYTLNKIKLNNKICFIMKKK